jgi:hypothetical protein
MRRPWKEEEREDVPLSKQWSPGEAIEVSLLKGVLTHLVQAPTKKDGANKIHRLRLKIHISARLTGSMVFDSNDRRILYDMLWIPSEFTPEKCQEVLKGYQTVVHHGPARPVTMPNLEDFIKKAQQSQK